MCRASKDGANACDRDEAIRGEGIFSVFIIGPTAVGKTALGVDLALALDGEVVNADSMQVFRGFDIGTAKPTAGEMRGVRHHMIDVVDPKTSGDWSVATFADEAVKAVRDIAGRGKLPIVVGGSGLYLNALLFDMDFAGAGSDEDFRRQIAETPLQFTPEKLYAILLELDPGAAASVHPNNTKRVIRAIERLRGGGEPDSLRSFKESFRPSSEIAPYTIRLTMERAKLYARIDERGEVFAHAGLAAEVEGLLASGVKPEANAMRGIGYKEVAEYLRGGCTLEEAMELIKRNSRRFAKRQETFFNRLQADLIADVGELGTGNCYATYLKGIVRDVETARAAHIAHRRR